MEIKIKDNVIKLKKDFLTNVEVNYIIKESLSSYMDSEEEDIEGYLYNPLAMMFTFYLLLFSTCLEDFDSDSLDDYEKYYSMGVQYELLRRVTNADEAYHTLISTSEKISSLENVLYNGINKVIKLLEEKMPEKDSMEKMMKKLPKDFTKAIDEYNNIFNKDNSTK